MPLLAADLSRLDDSDSESGTNLWPPVSQSVSVSSQQPRQCFIGLLSSSRDIQEQGDCLSWTHSEDAAVMAAVGSRYMIDISHRKLAFLYARMTPYIMNETTGVG